jgi:hypothetical protein
MNESDHERFVGNPPYFLFAFETQTKMGTITKRLIDQSKRSIDAIFILNQGAVLDLGDGKGDLQFKNPDGSTIGGWGCITGENICLASLLLWLSGMPDVQHQGSILSKYLLAALKSSNSTEQSTSLKEEEDHNA